MSGFKYDLGEMTSRRLNKVLVDSGLGDKEAARITGLSNQTIRNIRKNSRSYYNNETLIMFADGFGVSVDYLMGRVDEQGTDKYFEDRKLFLKKVYGEVARIEGAREKKEKGFKSYDEQVMACRDWKSFSECAPYPYNLINAVFEAGGKRDFGTRRSIAFLPADKDVEQGLNMALSQLEERQRDMMLMYYRDGKTLDEIGREYKVTKERARQLVSKGVWKLQCPQLMMQIIYGKNGYSARKRREKAERELAAAKLIEKDVKALKKDDEKAVQKVRRQAAKKRFLNDMNLSARSFNCLTREGFRTNEDVINFYKDKGYTGMMTIHGLGKKSLQEVMNYFDLWSLDRAEA